MKQEVEDLKTLNMTIVHNSFSNKCTFINTFITIYFKIRWLLHVSVYDHQQGTCNLAWLNLYCY